mmetsp:Transcript_107253/g.277561  ORF Transcript_107253/g.277561 Transcript_107253/m.277561 type:complete len:266 (-) Transcript_107253:10-807(-)
MSTSVSSVGADSQATPDSQPTGYSQQSESQEDSSISHQSRRPNFEEGGESETRVTPSEPITPSEEISPRSGLSSKRSPRSGVSGRSSYRSHVRMGTLATHYEQSNEDILGIAFHQLAQGEDELSAGDLVMRFQDLQASQVDAKLVHEVVRDLKGGVGRPTLDKEELVAAMEKHFDDSYPYEDLVEVWLLVGGKLPQKSAIIGGGEEPCISAKQFYEAVQKLGGELDEHEVEGLVGLAGGENGMLSYDNFVHLLTPPWGVPCLDAK